jgi:hypothetical protein
MRSGRSASGVIVGVLLGLGVVAFAGSGLNPYAMQAASIHPSFSQTNGNSTLFVLATTTTEASVASSGTNTTLGRMVGAAPLPQMDGVAIQSPAPAGFGFFPIFAAFLFGFVLYGVAKMRVEEEERPRGA